MKITDCINQAKSTLFSFELLPPLKGHSLESIYAAIDPLLEFNPFAVNITYHQEEIAYQKLDSGLIQPRPFKRRPGTVAISAAIKARYPQVNVVPHLICGGFSKEETEYALIDLNFLGFENILALRGDPVHGERYFTPAPGGHSNAIDLVRQIVAMNSGIYLDSNAKEAAPTNFCIGVAGYPEKHKEAPNLDEDLLRLKEKVDAGGQYIVTQMFFDNRKFFDFVGRCRAIGITVPIIPGLKPIRAIKEVSVIPQIFSIDIPQELFAEVQKCKTNEEAWQVGVEWTVMQSKELISKGVPVLHYYTLSKSDNIQKIAAGVF